MNEDMDDIDWIKERYGLSDDDLYDFIERVGIRVDSGFSEDTARNITLDEIIERKEL